MALYTPHFSQVRTLPNLTYPHSPRKVLGIRGCGWVAGGGGARGNCGPGSCDGWLVPLREEPEIWDLRYWIVLEDPPDFLDSKKLKIQPVILFLVLLNVLGWFGTFCAKMRKSPILYHDLATIVLPFLASQILACS